MTSTLHPLNNLSVIDGRYHAKIHELRDWFSEYGLIKHRLIVEVNWLIWMSRRRQELAIPSLSDGALRYLRDLIDNFDLKQAQAVKEIEKRTRHDVKAVELYLRDRLLEPAAPADLAAYSPYIHITCTSEDINNLAYALMVSGAHSQVLTPTLDTVLEHLRRWARDFHDTAMISLTHGQAATPTTWGKEIAIYIHRLSESRKAWCRIAIKGKFNGAVGNYNAHTLVWPDVDWLKFSRGFVESLGLDFNCYSTQIESGDWLVRWLNELSLINSIQLDFCRDMWGYISLDYLRAKKPAQGEVGSSTMPHKVNPIDFENAEGNLSLAIGIGQSLARDIPISRWQRDLSGSTRLRNLGSITGHSLLAWRSIEEGMSRVEVNESLLESELDTHYELLAEAVQTQLRMAGRDDAYEIVKSLTHNRKLDRRLWLELLEKLELEPPIKDRLLALTPGRYTGLASRLARMID